jgi:ribosomal protein S18 acetylase RimI-like enzyme
MTSNARPPLIRPLDAGDLPALKRVIDGTELFPSHLLDDMTAAILSGGSTDEIWLTLAAPDPVAVAYCAPERLTSGTWNLLLIAVDRDRQGQKLGSALMEHVESLLAQRGERLLLVETSGMPDFERTRAFYRGLDYDLEARIRDYCRDGDDKLVFRKRLASPSA